MWCGLEFLIGGGEESCVRGIGMSDVVCLCVCRVATLKLPLRDGVIEQVCMEAGVMLTGLSFVLESLTLRHAWR